MRAFEASDLLHRFHVELEKPTMDGAVKRDKGEKPPWYIDPAHEAAVYSHLSKWKKGELVDPDSGAHPLVHAACRLLMIACQETGNVPELVPRSGQIIHGDLDLDENRGESFA